MVSLRDVISVDVPADLTCQFVSHSVDDLNGFLVECFRLYQTVSNYKTHKQQKHSHTNTMLHQLYTVVSFTSRLLTAKGQQSRFKYCLAAILRQQYSYQRKKEKYRSERQQTEINTTGTHWRSEWIQALWSQVSCVCSLPDLFPPEPLHWTEHTV